MSGKSVHKVAMSGKSRQKAAMSGKSRQQRRSYSCKTMVDCTVTSPIGDLILAYCPRGVHTLSMSASTDEHFIPDRSRTVNLKHQDSSNDGCESKPASQCMDWLRSYFTTGGSVSHVPLPSMCCLSSSQPEDFRVRVLRTLAYKVPYGATVSYKELAVLSRSSSQASRAVGQAMRNNPVMLLVPCHRVVLSSGKTGNYSGGTMNSVKEWLLEFEKDNI